MGRPHIGECPFDQDKTRATEKAGEEPTDGKCCEALRITSAQDEQSEERQADEIYRQAAKPFAEMRRGDRSKGDTKKVQRQAKDGGSHRNTEFHHHSLNADGQRRNPEGPERSSTLVFLAFRVKSIGGIVMNCSQPSDRRVALTLRTQMLLRPQKHRPCARTANSVDYRDRLGSSCGPLVEPWLTPA